MDASCEITKSAGYDPTGEWAVECGAPGEYCSQCQLIVCPACHQKLEADKPHSPKKLALAVTPGDDWSRKQA